MMEPPLSEIILITMLRKKPIHLCNGCRLLIERPDMHTLHAQSLFYGQKFRFGKILLFLLFRLGERPVKITDIQ